MRNDGAPRSERRSRRRVGGALLGPVIGAVASHVGTGPAFAAATVAGGTLMVASVLRPQATCRPPARRLRSALPAIAEPAIAVGMWLTFLAGLAFGVVDVLAPAAAQPAGCRARSSSPAVFLGAAARRGRARRPWSAVWRTDEAAWSRYACL